MSQYLSSARYIDSAHPAVGAFAREHAQGRSDREKAVSLYYAVRDRIRYNPFLDFSRREAFQVKAIEAQAKLIEARQPGFLRRPSGQAT